MFCSKIRLIYVLVLLLLSWNYCLLAQEELFQHSSLDFWGGNMDGFPDGWFGHQEDSDWNDPSNTSSILSEDPARNHVYPIEGNTMLLLRTRGANFVSSSGIPSHGPYQNEYMIQQLKQPLKPFGCYVYKAFMFTSTVVNSTDANDNSLHPVKLQLWGGTSEEDNKHTLLVESEPISNTNWQEFEFQFRTDETEYPFITMNVACDTVNIKSQSYNGIILFDVMSLKQSNKNFDTIKHVDFYEGNGIHQLVPSEGNYFEWTINSENLSNDNIAHPTVNTYAEYFEVIVSGEGICNWLETFELIRICDEEIGADNYLEQEVMFQRDSTLLVSGAETGKFTIWEWVDNVNLIPVAPGKANLFNYIDTVTLHLYDDENCLVRENFLIDVDCELLFPAPITVMDTLLEEGMSIQLRPIYGQIDTSTWYPELYLSCTDCQSPMVEKPFGSMTYSIALTENFADKECIHTEIFKVEGPIIIPNVITPNNDSYNDNFVVPGLPKNTELYIFDKAGHELFYSENYDHSFNGGNMDAGTYWYVLKNDSKQLLEKGFLYIKR